MVSNNFMEIRRGGESLNVEILGEGGLKQFRKFRWKEGSKNRAFCWGEGVWTFSGILSIKILVHSSVICTNQMDVIFFTVIITRGLGQFV